MFLNWSAFDSTFSASDVQFACNNFYIVYFDFTNEKCSLFSIWNFRKISTEVKFFIMSCKIYQFFCSCYYIISEVDTYFRLC